MALIFAHFVVFAAGLVTALGGAALLFYAHVCYGDLRETWVSTPIGVLLFLIGISAMLCVGR